MKINRKFFAALALCALLASCGLNPALAQNAPAGQAAAVATVNYSAALATASAAAGSAATATISPPAGYFTYITAIELTVCGDATGDAAQATPVTFTFAGFTTNAIVKLDSTHTAGICISRFYNLAPFPMKSATTGSGVAQTITSSTVTHLIPNINVWGYFDTK